MIRYKKVYAIYKKKGSIKGSLCSADERDGEQVGIGCQIVHSFLLINE